jgi:outer membrane murein-binding lipoprotein Lpp
MNTQQLTTEEQERAAYMAGDTRAAELLAQIAQLEAERDALAEELENLKDSAADDSLERWENKNGSAEEYKEFFFDCFARLAGHYPAPDISSDYDKSVIFAAIEKGEELDANGGAD